MGAVLSCNHDDEDAPLQDAYTALEMRHEAALDVIRSFYHQEVLDPEQTELVETLFDEQGQPL